MKGLRTLDAQLPPKLVFGVRFFSACMLHKCTRPTSFRFFGSIPLDSEPCSSLFWRTRLGLQVSGRFDPLRSFSWQHLEATFFPICGPARGRDQSSGLDLSPQGTANSTSSFAVNEKSCRNCRPCSVTLRSIGFAPGRAIETSETIQSISRAAFPLTSCSDSDTSQNSMSPFERRCSAFTRIFTTRLATGDSEDQHAGCNVRGIGAGE